MASHLRVLLDTGQLNTGNIELLSVLFQCYHSTESMENLFHRPNVHHSHDSVMC